MEIKLCYNASKSVRCPHTFDYTVSALTFSPTFLLLLSLILHIAPAPARCFLILVWISVSFSCSLTSCVRRSSGGGGAVVLSSTTLPAPDHVSSCQRYGGDVQESSDEAEAELSEELEKTSWHYSSYHPRPVRVRTLGLPLEICSIIYCMVRARRSAAHTQDIKLCVLEHIKVMLECWYRNAGP